jgi:MarR family transcriptional regulator, temperature-dependent positive regulator of motility
MELATRETQREMKPAPIHDDSVLALLYRAHQVSNDYFQQVFGDNGLTPRQLAVLSAVARNEGASQTDIVEMTGVDRSTLADIVRRLIKKGLLTRRRTKTDARTYAVRLTPAGESVLAEATPLAEAVEERLLTPLPAARRSELLRDLETLALLNAKTPGPNGAM